MHSLPPEKPEYISLKLILKYLILVIFETCRWYARCISGGGGHDSQGHVSLGVSNSSQAIYKAFICAFMVLFYLILVNFLKSWFFFFFLAPPAPLFLSSKGLMQISNWRGAQLWRGTSDTICTMMSSYTYCKLCNLHNLHHQIRECIPAHNISSGGTN